MARSTLAEANEKRDFRIFMDTAMVATARSELPMDKSHSHFDGNVYALRFDDLRPVPVVTRVLSFFFQTVLSSRTETNRSRLPEH